MPTATSRTFPPLVPPREEISLLRIFLSDPDSDGKTIDLEVGVGKQSHRDEIQIADPLRAICD